MRILSLEQAVDYVLALNDQELRLALPLGLGKPVALANRVYERFKVDSARSLRIYTGLSLTLPRASDPLARAFLAPFVERHFGKDHVEPAYAVAARKDQLPRNVRVHEFYIQAGSGLGSTTLQRDYRSLNYTHVTDSLVDAGIHGILQLVAKRGEGASARYSLSCNPDLTRDVVDRFREAGRPLAMIGVVHPGLPFLGGDAEVDQDFFTAMVDDPSAVTPLFTVPRMPVATVEHAIGFHASRLVPDGGTLQIGIGSLSDAVTAALILRHENNAAYRSLAAGLPAAHDGPFVRGLYGLSEMVMDGFMHLRKAGILRRTVVDERDGRPAYLHGAFALGSKPFFAWLASLSSEDYDGLHMSRVSRVNDIYDPNETDLRKQRHGARFLNTCMQVTALGGAASETLANGKVVSGVGGQYNFVAMAHELAGARSVMMLRSTRLDKGRLSSNVVWSHPHLTIPRHLRDVVVTEYGVADLRGKSDEETIIALLQVTDAAFQEDLMETAKRNGKLRPDYRLPDAARRNTRAEVERFVARGRAAGAFSPFPFGSDFTPAEERLALALDRLKEEMAKPRGDKLRSLWALARRGGPGGSGTFAAELDRMGLGRPAGWKARLTRRLLLGALRLSDGGTA